jgi:DNA polymerase (family 10)
VKDRFQIAGDLRKIAGLLKIKGENPFKAQAYVRGAVALENLKGDLSALVRDRRLQEIPGIGSALAAIIEEIYLTDECWLLDQLRGELPPGAEELSAIPGLSIKKIAALHDALQIDSIAGLRAACQEGLISRVKGFGAKSQAKLLADIDKIEKLKTGVFLLNDALKEAERLVTYLRGCPELVRVDVAGALRRRRETIGQLPIIASSDQPRSVIDRFLAYPPLVRTDALEDARCLAQLASGLVVDLVIVSPGEHVITLHRHTGSRRHIAKLHALAQTRPAARQGPASIKEEDEIYRRLGLQPIAPELREDEGEIEAAQAGTLPQLVNEADLRGATHCHTHYSDGRNSIEEMALAAEAMGMRYLTITDHSPSAFYARGVTVDRLRAQWDEIARVQERVKIKILKGTESDILADGVLDYPDHMLEQFDIIIASVHSRHKMDAEQMTARLLRALSLPLFKIWGHPLGRLLPSRPPFDCRMEEILDAAAESRCAIEINGDPHRLDLEPRWIRAARERGVKFIVSTDAHSTDGLGYLPYGVAMARRGWLSRGDILNTLDTEEFMRAVHP